MCWLILQKILPPMPWFHRKLEVIKELKDLSHRETERGQCYSQRIDEKPRMECHTAVIISNEINPILLSRLNCSK